MGKVSKTPNSSVAGSHARYRTFRYKMCAKHFAVCTLHEASQTAKCSSWWVNRMLSAIAFRVSTFSQLSSWSFRSSWMSRCLVVSLFLKILNVFVFNVKNPSQFCRRWPFAQQHRSLSVVRLVKNFLPVWPTVSSHLWSYSLVQSNRQTRKKLLPSTSEWRIPHCKKQENVVFGALLQYTCYGMQPSLHGELSVKAGLSTGERAALSNTRQQRCSPLYG